MNVHFRFLRQAGLVQEVLRKDGWKLERGHDKFLMARHPDVANESAARDRLCRLGLLTSSSLAIEFRPLPTILGPGIEKIDGPCGQGTG
jgi:hypothetical protein